MFLIYFISSKVPAFLHVTDIAGLVQGAHEGQVNNKNNNNSQQILCEIK